MSSSPKSIVIADDHQLFIDGLNMVLSADPDLVVIDVANDGNELMELLQKQQPDLILLDINMPRLNGLEALKFIRQKYKGISIIILSTYSDMHLIAKAREFGANGYLLKNSSKQELLTTIQRVLDGEQIFHAIGPVNTTVFGERDAFLKQFNLTPREVEILRLIKENLTNAEIAQRLYLSVYTIETHRKNIMRKLGIKKPVALIKFIIEQNL